MAAIFTMCGVIASLYAFSNGIMTTIMLGRLVYVQVERHSNLSTSFCSQIVYQQFSCSLESE